MTDGIIFREGFDIYNGTGTNVGVQTAWQVAEGTIGTWQMTAGRLGGQAVRGTGEAGGGGNSTIRRQFDADVTEFSFGFAFRIGQFMGSLERGQFIAFMRDFFNYEWGLGLTQDGRITCNRMENGSNGGPQLGRTAAGVLKPNVWQYIEIECKLGNADGQVRVFVDGDTTPALNLNNVDNLITGPNINTVALTNRQTFAAGGTLATPYDYDDMYARDSMVRLGQRRVETIRILGNGAHQESIPSTGTDRAAMLDDLTVDSSDYVTFPESGDYDEYTVAPLTGAANIIDEINVIAYAQKTDAATRAMVLGIDSGGVVSDGPDRFLATAPSRYQRAIPQDPDGDVNWNRAAVNNLLLRPKVSV